MKPTNIWKVIYQVGEEDCLLVFKEYTSMHPFDFIKKMEKRFAEGAPLKIRSYTDLGRLIQGVTDEGIVF